MARCRCAAGSCECHLVAGTNVQIVGVGDVTDPYVISANPSARDAIVFLDNPEVEFNVLGSGIPIDPYAISATLPWVDVGTGVPGEVLTKQVDGTWAPGPAANSARDAIVFVDGAEVVFDVTGQGVPEDPYAIAAVLPWVDPTAGAPGEVLAKQVDGSWAPAPPVTAAPGAITVGPALAGDGSSQNPLRTAIVTGPGVVGTGTLADPLRICLRTYDELKAARNC